MNCFLFRWTVKSNFKFQCRFLVTINEKTGDFKTHLKLLSEGSSFLYMLKTLMKCHQKKNRFDIIIDFVLLSENKLQYRNRTVKF